MNRSAFSQLSVQPGEKNRSTNKIISQMSFIRRNCAKIIFVSTRKTVKKKKKPKCLTLAQHTTIKHMMFHTQLT